jgi:threonyl-tRNA synthetase
MSGQNQDFKVELLELLRTVGSTAVAKETGDESAAAGETGVDQVSFYTVSDFVDLCRGPHVSDTSAIGAFKLTSIAGAYWRGNEHNPQMQRIYGLCFDTEAEIEQELWRQEQMKLRDHRKLGRELDIFAFAEEVGIGLPLWLPNGAVLRRELEYLAGEYETRYGYQQVITPEIARAALYVQSGHLPYYKDDMYPPMKLEDEEFYLRAMNCPHHHHVFLARPHSYREMPVRLAEYGKVFRYEAHGALSGLMRTRGFCQNDAHIYCTFDQAKDEFIRVMNLHADYYRLFDIQDFWMRLSLPDLTKLEKYVDEPAKWVAALDIIRAAAAEGGFPCIEVEGEAAFYGPKIDFMVRSAIGTEYAISTNQLDFLATSRFDLTYRAADGTDQPVYVIHRAPLGSHERFVGFLLEHYAGNFPTWLAPTQVAIIPIADRHIPYAERVKSELTNSGIHTATFGPRVLVDASAERMQKKIRNAQAMKIPIVLVVGDREAEQGTAAVRLRGGRDLGAMPIAAVIDRLRTEITTRRDLPVDDQSR